LRLANLATKSNKRLIFIFLNRQPLAKQLSKQILNNIKVINVTGDEVTKDDIDRILWFSFSYTKETYLRLTLAATAKVYQPSYQKYWQKLKIFSTKKRLVVLFISLFIVLHLLFIPPLIASFIFTYQAFLSFRQEDFKTATSQLTISTPLLKTSKKLYRLVRPTYLLFSVALFPDNFIDAVEKVQTVVGKSYQISLNAKEVQKLLFKKDKSSEEKAYLTIRIKKLKNDIAFLEENLNLLNQKVPAQFTSLQTFKRQLSEVADGLSKLKKILAYVDTILAKETEKKYLIFFANNMELRPGGGFLGSFGILNVKDYTIEDIKVYDVYDADGQLTAHIDPQSRYENILICPIGFCETPIFPLIFWKIISKPSFS
jgi:hypothetical protein